MSKSSGKLKQASNVASLEQRKADMTTQQTKPGAVAPKVSPAQQAVTAAKVAPANVLPAATKPLATDEKAVGFLNPKALQADAGRKTVEAYARSEQSIEQLSHQLVEAKNSQATVLPELTWMFYNAAKADSRIKLEHFVTGSKGEKEAVREQLDVAIGIKVATILPDGKPIIQLSPWARNLFPYPGEAKEKDADGNLKDAGLLQKKNNLRTNFAAQVKKCVMSAHAIIVNSMELERNGEGTLLISGDVVKQHFGLDKVALDGAQEVKRDGSVIKLSKAPSYAELQRMAEVPAGKELPAPGGKPSVVSAVAPSAGTADPSITEPTVIQGIGSLKALLNRIKAEHVGPALVTAVRDLRDHLDTFLEANTKSEPTT